MQKNEKQLSILHPIPPVCDKNSVILILGSFPSVRSREEMFFYGHPQNRFWKVLSAVFGCDTPVTVQEKKKLLISKRVALWDVVMSCEITGSSDSSIKNAVPNDLDEIFDRADIQCIFLNGKTAEKYYNRYMRPKADINVYTLPSTSPANAAWSLERLVGAWKIIKEYTE